MLSTLALSAAGWLLPPVPGPVVGDFAGGASPFARGLRRAVVLRADAGAPVRAPCSGRVAFAGRVPQGPGVTLRCGERRVTVMAVRGAVAPGSAVRRGARVGTAVGDVRLSVREPDGAYVAPRLAPALGAPPSPVVRPPRARAPRGAPAPPAAPPSPLPRVPWPVWAGAALLLAAGVRVRARAARAARRPVASAAR